MGLELRAVGHGDGMRADVVDGRQPVGIRCQARRQVEQIAFRRRIGERRAGGLLRRAEHLFEERAVVDRCRSGDGRQAAALGEAARRQAHGARAGRAECRGARQRQRDVLGSGGLGDHVRRGRSDDDGRGDGRRCGDFDRRGRRDEGRRERRAVPPGRAGGRRGRMTGRTALRAAPLDGGRRRGPNGLARPPARAPGQPGAAARPRKPPERGRARCRSMRRPTR